MPFHGYNVNCIVGNKTIPNGYMMNPATPWEDVVKYVNTIQSTIRCNSFRCILWPGERDDVFTPWLHIPFTKEEVNRIFDVTKLLMYSDEVTLPHVTLVWGALWEALPESIAGAFPYDPKPDNPFATMEELAAATLKCYEDLFDRLKDLPVSRLNWDIWNEIDVRTQPKNMEFLASIYPQIVKYCVDAGIDYTASTIIEPNGNTTRAILTYRALEKIQRLAGLPKFEFLSANMNGFTDEGMLKDGCNALAKLKTTFGRPILISETDCETSAKTEVALRYHKPRNIIYWR